MVNHFYQNGFITSKVGLTYSLKRLPYWTNTIAMNNFYPRCFCVHRNDKLMKKYQKDQENLDPTFEWDRFTDYYRVVYAESVLKLYLKDN